MIWLQDLITRLSEFVTTLVTTRPRDWDDNVVTELGLAFILAIGGAILVVFRKAFIASLRPFFALLRGPGALSEPTITPEHAHSQRKNLIAVVRSQWIHGYLEKSIHRRVLLHLGLSEQPGAVTYPWALEVQRSAAPPRTSDLSHIAELYDEFAGALLILGDPGAGKTITLLELARILLLRAEQDPNRPIPVVFNLASWVNKQQSLSDWLVEEMDRLYNVPPALGRYWVGQRHILPLLDGLDEVRENARKRCIKIISAYHDVRSPIVVCCRRREYAAMERRLRLNGALYIQPLDPGQIEAYLTQLGHSELQALLAADSDLQQLASSPLMLNVMVVAEEEMAPLATGLSLEEKRSRILDAYLRRMLLQHRTARRRWPPTRMLHWLRWLAQQLVSQDLTFFRLDGIQADWLPSPSARQQLHQIKQWSIPLAFALVIGLGISLTLGLTVNMVFGCTLGLVLGVSIGLVVRNEVVQKTTLRPVTGLRWDTRAFMRGFLSRDSLVVGVGVGLIFAVVTGILGGVVFEPIGRFVFGLVGGLSFGLVFGLVNGLERGIAVQVTMPSTGSSPNAFIWRSGGSWLVFGLIFGLGVGVVGGLGGALVGGLGGYRGRVLGELFIFGPADWSIFGIVFGLTFGTVIGLISGLEDYGGYVFLYHWVLRYMLWRFDHAPAPWLMMPWLDEACKRILLYRTGGSYLFIHRLLMAHVAALDDHFMQELDDEYRRRNRMN